MAWRAKVAVTETEEPKRPSQAGPDCALPKRDVAGAQSAGGMTGSGENTQGMPMGFVPRPGSP